MRLKSLRCDKGQAVVSYVSGLLMVASAIAIAAPMAQRSLQASLQKAQNHVGVAPYEPYYIFNTSDNTNWGFKVHTVDTDSEDLIMYEETLSAFDNITLPANAGN